MSGKHPAESEVVLKVLIIGDSNVGKTSFVQRYISNNFRGTYKWTIGGFKHYTCYKLISDALPMWIRNAPQRDYQAFGLQLPEWEAIDGLVKRKAFKNDQRVTLMVFNIFVDFGLKVIQWSPKETIKLQLWDIAGQERYTSMTRVYYKDAFGCVVMCDITQRQTFKSAALWKKDLDLKCTLPDCSPVPCILLANKDDLPSHNVTEKDLDSFCKEHNFTAWANISVKDNRMIKESMSYLLEEMMNKYHQVNKQNGQKDDFTSSVDLQQKKDSHKCC